MDMGVGHPWETINLPTKYPCPSGLNKAVKNFYSYFTIIWLWLGVCFRWVGESVSIKENAHAISRVEEASLLPYFSHTLLSFRIVPAYSSA